MSSQFGHISDGDKVHCCLLGTGLTHKLKVCQADSACCRNGSLYTTVCHMSNQRVLPSSTGLVLDVNLLVSCIEAEGPAATQTFANWLPRAERKLPDPGRTAALLVVGKRQ